MIENVEFQLIYDKPLQEKIDWIGMEERIEKILKEYGLEKIDGWYECNPRKRFELYVHIEK